MDIGHYIHLVFSIIVWIVVFILIKPKRIKELLPVAIFSIIILFGAEEFILTIGLAKFINPFLPIVGIPFFHLIWAAGSGILFMNYIKKEFVKKIAVISIFAIFTVIFRNITDMVGGHSHIASYNNIHCFVFDFLVLLFLVFISEGILGDRIYSKK